MKKILGFLALLIFLIVSKAYAQDANQISLCATISYEDAVKYDITNFGRYSLNDTDKTVEWKNLMAQDGSACNTILKGREYETDEGVFSQRLTISPHAQPNMDSATLWYQIGLQENAMNIERITYNYKIYQKLDETLSAKLLQKIILTNTGLQYTEPGDSLTDTVGDFVPEAVSKLYEIGATKYYSVDTFQAGEYFTREQAAKFFTEVATAIGYENSNTNTCKFSDIGSADTTLKSYILDICHLGIMKGSSGKFYPKSELTLSEATAVLMRMKDGMLNENVQPWYLPYFNNAFNIDLFMYRRHQPIVMKNMAISRGDIALMIYRLLEIEGK